MANDRSQFDGTASMTWQTLWKFLKRLNICIVHKWEVSPSDLEPIRPTGVSAPTFSLCGIQRGSRKCLICHKRQRVYREGLIGFGGPVSPAQAGRWIILDSEKDKEIESLPTL